MAQVWRTDFTVQTGQVPSAQSNFTVAIVGNDARFKNVGSGGHVNDGSGFDLRPYSDAACTTELKFDLVAYESSTGKFEIWVKVPTLSDGYVIHMGYGDTGLTVDGSDRTATWSNNFVVVTHGGDGFTLDLLNSASGSWNGTNVGMSVGTDGPTLGYFNGSSGPAYGYIAGSNGLVTGQAVTFSAWLKGTGTGGVAIFGSSDPTGFDWIIYRGGNGHYYVFVFTTGSVSIDTGVSASDTTWHLVTCTYDGANVRAYVDGALIGSPAAQTGDLRANGSSRVGWNDYLQDTGNAVACSFDETHICNTVRSADWIATEYNNQNPDEAFFSIAAETVPSEAVLSNKVGSMLAMFQ